MATSLEEELRETLNLIVQINNIVSLLAEDLPRHLRNSYELRRADQKDLAERVVAAGEDLVAFGIDSANSYGQPTSKIGPFQEYHNGQPREKAGELPSKANLTGAAVAGNFIGNTAPSVLKNAMDITGDIAENATNPFVGEQEKALGTVESLVGFVPGATSFLKDFFNEEGITTQRRAAQFAEQDTNAFINKLVAEGVDPTDEMINRAASIFTDLGLRKAQEIEQGRKFLSDVESDELRNTDFLLSGLEKIFNDLFEFLSNLIPLDQANKTNKDSASVGGE